MKFVAHSVWLDTSIGSGKHELSRIYQTENETENRILYMDESHDTYRNIRVVDVVRDLHAYEIDS